MPDLVGDQLKDAAQLKATSPIQQAPRIKAPLLLAYGGSDRRVPTYYGRKFLDAVKPHNGQVEWIEYADEGHGWSLPQNRVDFWARSRNSWINISAAARRTERESSPTGCLVSDNML
ncbi:alpha/beta hydrolase family protein [Massilia sp. CMS3.1]|uniref:alpha/beta hydrolase family protein n=1 Tax=Massilia sp. CMS3.1 TaxID=3373083 RepID=UPI003EE511D4